MSKKKIILIIAVVAVLVVAIAVGVVVAIKGMMNRLSSLEEYEVGDYAVTAITKVVGERKVVGMSTAVKNGVSIKSYTYEGMEEPLRDLEAYLNYLAENEGFILDRNEGYDQIGGKAFAHKETEGGTLLLEIHYNTSGYSIHISL